MRVMTLILNVHGRLELTPLHYDRRVTVRNLSGYNEDYIFELSGFG
jgi:hypothetical protein